MSVAVANVVLADSFDSWRLRTNLIATTLSNNVITVSRSNANRGGVVAGNGHVAGTFTANVLRASTIQGGNTSTSNPINVLSNTTFSGTSFTVNSNTVFNANVTFSLGGSERLTLGTLSRIRLSGGTRGQFIRIATQTDTPEFKTLTLRDISSLTSNSAHLLMSGANTSFASEGSANNSPTVRFRTASGDEFLLYAEESATAGVTKAVSKLETNTGNSYFDWRDSANNSVAQLDKTGRLNVSGNLTSNGVTTSQHILPVSDNAVDLGAPNREFRNAYIDGTVNADVLVLATGANEGIGSSIIPTTTNTYNIGSNTRKFNNIWSGGTIQGYAAKFQQNLSVNGTLTSNGSVDFNGPVVMENVTLNNNITVSGNTFLNGHVTFGNSANDDITFGSTVAHNALVSMNSNTKYADNQQAVFGTGNDLRIYHDGSHSYISDQGTGQLRVLTSQFTVMNAGGTETLLSATENGAATLYYNNNSKIATSVNGVTLNNTVSATGNVSIAGSLTATSQATSLKQLAVSNNVVVLGNTSSSKIVVGQANTNPNIDFEVGRSARINKNLVVLGNTTIQTNLTVEGSFTVPNNAVFSIGSGSFVNLEVTGNTSLGSDGSDLINVNARVNDDWTPVTGTRQNLGGAGSRWANLHANNIHTGNKAVIGQSLTVLKNATVKGNTDISGTISNDGTLVVSSNGKLFVNNAIADSSIALSKIAASTITNDADIGTSHAIVLGETQTFTGNNGIRTVINNNTLTIDGINATTSVKGIASFNSSDFSVSSGAVSIKTDGISASQIANVVSAGATVGSSTAIPVITYNDSGQIVGATTATVAGVTNLTYTAANGVINVVTSSGSFKAPLSNATTSVKGIASFNSSDFSVSSGAVSLATDITVDGQLNVGENAVISGNLYVQGTTFTVDSETVRIADNIIVLNEDHTGVPTLDAGFIVERGDLSDVSFLWDETNDTFSTEGQSLTATGGYNGNLNGNANTATVLATARNIGGASFDGSENINVDPQVEADNSTNATRYLTFVDAATGSASRLNTDTGLTFNPSTNALTTTTFIGALTGNASTATVLATARNIGGASFNGSANINVDPQVEADNSTDATRYPVFVDAATGSASRLNTDTAFTFNPSTNTLTSGDFNTTSDRSLKENIRDISEEDLDKFEEVVCGYLFNYKASGKESVGVMHDEVFECFPQLINEVGGINYVNYDALVPVLIELNKRRKEEVKELRSDINNIKSHLNIS